MTLRDHLRGWLRIKENTGPNAPKANDEEILNVLRREKQREDGEEYLTTDEIKEKLPIERKRTRQRLKEIEDERVTKRRAGSTDMWSLAEGEPETVMDPEMGQVVALSSKARRTATDVRWLGRRIAELGFVLLFIGMTILISEMAAPDIRSIFLALGYSAGLVAGALIGASATLKLFGLIAPRLVERFLVD